MIKYFTHKSNDLNVTYVYKPDFQTCYAGIGTRFGGCYTEYIKNGQKVELKPGLAHFIEHKLFQTDSGDAVKEFHKLGAIVNAYTGADSTVYYFNTTDNLIDCIKLLINMYFTPVFIEEDVEKEKSIIISEINDAFDTPQSKFFMRLLRGIFPNDPISEYVGGTKETVSNISVNDLRDAYNDFYNSSNSELVIVGNLEPKLIFEEIDKVMSNYSFSQEKIERIPFVKSTNCSEDFEEDSDIEQTLISIGIRFEANNSLPLFCDYMIGIFDCLFSPSADFFEELYNKKAFLADIDYYVVTHEDVGYAVITTNSNNPKLFFDESINKLKNISVDDLNEEILDLFIRHSKATAIRDADSVEKIGDEILNLRLEHLDYFEKNEMFYKMTVDDFNFYLQFLRNAKYITGVCKKSRK